MMDSFIRIIAVSLIIFISSCQKQTVTDDALTYVDPQIGGVGLLLQPTRPTVHLPNQMIRVYPVRKDYLDDQIRYFPLTIISHRLGELFGIISAKKEYTRGVLRILMKNPSWLTT